MRKSREEIERRNKFIIENLGKGFTTKQLAERFSVCRASIHIIHAKGTGGVRKKEKLTEKGRQVLISDARGQDRYNVITLPKVSLDRDKA